MDDLIRNAEKIEVFRVRSGASDDGPFRNLTVLREAFVLDLHQQARLKRIFLDPAALVPKRDDADFESGLLFRFTWGPEVGDVAICLISGSVEFDHQTKTAALAKEAGKGCLTAQAFGEAVRFARVLFPGDPEIAKLHLT